MSAKALAYAENQLGVHSVFEGVQQHLEYLDTQLGDLDKALDAKRAVNEKIEDREAQLIGEKRGTHPEMTDTGFQTRLKEWRRKDPELQLLRAELNIALAEIQGAEMDLELTRARIKTGCARMEQLGGYLNYLASVKNATPPKVQTQAE